MRTSESIKNLAMALAKVQAAVEPARKKSVNPHYKSKYADLSAVWEALQPELEKNGLVVMQGSGLEPQPHVWTRLVHATSGEWVEGQQALILDKQTPQGVGSALTYFRRYGLAAICGLTQEEDDAESATDRARKLEDEDVARMAARGNGNTQRITETLKNSLIDYKDAGILVGGQAKKGKVSWSDYMVKFKKRPDTKPEELTKGEAEQIVAACVEAEKEV